MHVVRGVGRGRDVLEMNRDCIAVLLELFGRDEQSLSERKRVSRLW